MLSKSQMLFGILLFYIIGGLFVGFWNQTFNDYSLDSEESQISDNKVFAFIPSIVSSFKDAPAWLNILFFTPFVITMTFIVVTSLPTFNGGA